MSGIATPPSVLLALIVLNAVAVEANAQLAVVHADVAAAIAVVATEVADGRHDDQFSVDMFETAQSRRRSCPAGRLATHQAPLAPPQLGALTRGGAVLHSDQGRSLTLEGEYPTALAGPLPIEHLDDDTDCGQARPPDPQHGELVQQPQQH